MDYNCVCQPAALLTPKLCDKWTVLTICIISWIMILAGSTGRRTDPLPTRSCQFQAVSRNQDAVRTQSDCRDLCRCERHGGYVGAASAMASSLSRAAKFLKLVGKCRMQKRRCRYTALRLGNLKLTPFRRLGRSRARLRRIAQTHCVWMAKMSHFRGRDQSRLLAMMGGCAVSRFRSVRGAGTRSVAGHSGCPQDPVIARLEMRQQLAIAILSR